MPGNKPRYPEYLPLRRFAKDGLYTTAYLSLLVQRGSLRAKKIGRNYFTTKDYFCEYLDKHAREEIRSAYYAQDASPEPGRRAKPANSGFFVGKNWLVRYLLPGLGLVLLIFGSAFFISELNDKDGVVAGAVEGVASTTISDFGY